MFISFFNHIKLLLWSSILYLNYRWTNVCNLDLLNIVLYNVQNTNSLAIKCIQKIIPYLKMTDCDKNIIDLLNKTYEEIIFIIPIKPL